MNTKEIVTQALDLAKKRLSEMPTYPIYISCVTQLEYLLAVLNAEIPVDRQKLRTIMIGHYGLREFEESDPEFATLLKDAQLIASNMAQGLKV